jgi:hypothetical protein
VLHNFNDNGKGGYDPCAGLTSMPPAISTARTEKTVQAVLQGRVLAGRIYALPVPSG